MGFLRKKGAGTPLQTMDLSTLQYLLKLPCIFQEIFGVYKHFWRMLPAASFLSELLPPNI